MTISHNFHSNKPDSGDTTLVNPSNWNDTHAITLPFAVPTGRTASYVIAASDAPANVKAQADKVCSGSTDTADITAALAQLSAGRTWKERIVGIGTFTLSDQIVLPSYTDFDFSQAKLVSAVGGTTNHNLVKALDCTDTDITIGMIDGQWQDLPNSVGVLMDGCQYCSLDVFGESLQTLVIFLATDRNCAMNKITRIATPFGQTVCYGIKLMGSALNTKVVTMNEFDEISIYLAGLASTGIDFTQYCDGNYFNGKTFLYTGYSGQIGVCYNSSSPSNDMGVYENHFENLTIDEETTGCISIQVNKTTPNYPSFIMLRTAGGYDSAPVVTNGGDIQLYDSNIAGTYSQNSGTALIADGGTISCNLIGTPITVSVVGSTAGDILTVTSASASTITVAIKKCSNGSGDATPQNVYWSASIGNNP